MPVDDAVVERAGEMEGALERPLEALQDPGHRHGIGDVGRHHPQLGGRGHERLWPAGDDGDVPRAVRREPRHELLAQGAGAAGDEDAVDGGIGDPLRHLRAQPVAVAHSAVITTNSGASRRVQAGLMQEPPLENHNGSLQRLE